MRKTTTQRVQIWLKLKAKPPDMTKVTYTKHFLYPYEGE